MTDPVRFNYRPGFFLYFRGKILLIFDHQLKRKNPMTTHQLLNLKRLADFLYDPSIPKHYFDMGTFQLRTNNPLGYLGVDGKEVLPYQVEPECNTIACAAGHGKAAGCGSRFPGEDWGNYVERTFGTEPSSQAFIWLFAHEWTDRDNTPIGAAQRIYWYLTRGIPDQLYDYINGTIPLPYRSMGPLDVAHLSFIE